MNILHIITGLNDGGAEAVLYRLCIHDLADRHQVISLMDEGKYGQLLAAAGIRVTCLGMPRGRVTLGALWRLWREIRRAEPDVVQTWLFHADLLGGVVTRLAGRRNVCWGIHTTTLDPREIPRSTILVARICKNLSRLVPRRVVCGALKARDVHARMGYYAARLRVIPNGYDLSVFRPDPEQGVALREALGIDLAAPVIGFVARFDPVKDHANLLEALAILRRWGVAPTCLLVGTGMEAENAELARQIAEAGVADQVRLLGRRTDIPAVMNALDLHVMSSSSEAFPNVLAEAMACGTPCVSTDVGDAVAILGDTGRIVPPRDPAALAEAMGALLAERAGPDWSARRETARRHVADNFSIEKMVDSYRRVWFDEESSDAEL